MRIVLMANNVLGRDVARYFRDRNENVVGLVLHPPEHDGFHSPQRYVRTILSTLNLASDRVFYAPALREPDAVCRIAALEPDIMVTAGFAYVLKPDVLRLPPYGAVNMHPTLLPYNRGWHPNVWPFLDGTPSGVTIHYLDDGVDTGDIIAQRRVEILPTDTGKTLHLRQIAALFELFCETWPSIKAGTAPRVPQRPEGATYHLRREMDVLDRIDLDRSYQAGWLIGLLRGRTYPPYPAAYFEEGRERIYIRVQLLREDELETEPIPGIDE